ncbi:hypothetical protein V6K52_02125 [Knoellia sp. S7-12]|uniref:DUF4333 domain-containing protein n=1 Tax=Knoellia sp. S7-12 TaxID=3126698 RepID=UPI003367BC51
MTFTPPTPGEPQRAPSAPMPYAAHSPAVAGPPGSGQPVSPPTPPQGSPGHARARPSWVAWTALGLSALSFLIATSIGIIYAAHSLSGTEGSQGSEGEGLYYDAGMPSWGSVDLSATGQAEKRSLTDSVEEALKQGIEDFDGNADDISNVSCEGLAPKKDSVATCSVTVQDYDSTVVLFFLDDDGGYLATLY